MTTQENSDAAPGWVGGFAESNPEFAYPIPDLSSLKILGNMANIPLLQRQQAVKWPEFSWNTEMDQPDQKRCYQMFAPDISRLGYTDEGRVYSIICPQQGISSRSLGSMNVEVTVTGQRGWVNETNRELAADMGVVGKIWFSPSAHLNPVVKVIWDIFNTNKLPFPSSKDNAIVVTTHKLGEPGQLYFSLTKGQSSEFDIPAFAKHESEAWSVGNLSIQIGPIIPTGYEIVDNFNQLVLDIFNFGSGNMLQNKNVLSWNVWFTPPALVNQQEWSEHAEKWRKSIDADHGSPDGPGTDARYYDGSPFKIDLDFVEEEEKVRILDFLDKVEHKEKDKVISYLKNLKDIF